MQAHDPRRGAPALARCVGDPAAFARDIWARRPLVRQLATGDREVAAPGSGEGFEDLLTLDAVDHLLSSTALRTPAFRLVRGGSVLPHASYTKTGRISSVPMTGLADPFRIFAEFDAGATIVLQGMHRYWPPVARFCRSLELALGHPCQANAYVTPPGAAGLALHEDSHDVFVLQAFGSKHWEVHAAPAEMADGGREPVHAVLRPGDALYMPRATPHAARTQEALSGHLTVGILATTWRTLVDDVATRLKGQASLGLDEPLPVGYHVELDAFRAATRERLAELARHVDKMDPAELADGAADRFLTTRPALARGGLVDAWRARSLDDDTLVRRRDGVICELRIRGERLGALLGDRELRMPSWAEPAMRAIATLPAGGAMRPRDLDGELDAESRVVLVRRLVREGLLEIAEGRAGDDGTADASAG
jgi:bifunctional lysine-specific demethylase and histidyl-hydroxylase NO66